MDNEEPTRVDNLPLWAERFADELRASVSKDVVALGHRIQEHLAAMIVAAEERITQHASDRYGELMDSIRELSASVREQGERTRTNSSELAGRIQGALNAAERAANHVLQQSQDVSALKGQVDEVNAKLILMQRDGVRLLANGNGARGD
jgi:methyl-accepting chemotaxis protein